MRRVALPAVSPSDDQPAENGPVPLGEVSFRRHYTPAELARRMVKSSLDSLNLRDAGRACRILDPACGEGAFLLEAFDELCARSIASAGSGSRGDPPAELTPAGRLDIVRRSLLGIDIDRAAVAALRAGLLDRIGPTPDLIAQAETVVRSNIRVGDALTGPDFSSTNPPAKRNFVPPAIDWTRTFSDVASAGGFDLVIGNPPYLRERDARGLFERVAATDLGRRWREARMDLWYYFVHRGLDLLRPGGVLSFVVNSYWTASRGAQKLIARLQREAQFEEIELLGDARLFAGVAGRHMVMRLRKCDGSANSAGAGDWSVFRPCTAPRCSLPARPPINSRKTDLSPSDPVHSNERVHSRSVERDDACRVVDRASGGAPREFSIAPADLFEGGRMVLSPPDRLHAARERTRPLETWFDTRQGMAENPPAINGRLAREFGGQYEVGEGVFVLRPEEVVRLDFGARERRLLRPYYETRSIGRYRLPAEPTHQVLYLTRATAPSLDDFPRIARHLARFRPILERRREVARGRCAWWHLHWPRAESIFTRPRILSVQMGRHPQFAFAETPTFVGFSVNLILPRPAAACSLPALTGLLNSTLAAGWFERHAKRRGTHLDINAHVLRQFPLPAPDAPLDRQMASLVLARQAISTAGTGSAHSAATREGNAAATLDAQIDALAEKWYGV